MRWFGPTSTEWMPPVEVVIRILDGAENPVRVAFMLIARIELVFTSPNTRSPLMPAPNPHETQDLAAEVRRQVLRVGRVVPLADHHVELVVGTEEDPATVVVRV